MSSEKFSARFRTLVFALFLIALIIFGLIYSPAGALSQPRSNMKIDAVPQHASIR